MIKIKSRPRMPRVFVVTKADVVCVAVAGALFGMAIVMMVVNVPK